MKILSQVSATLDNKRFVSDTFFFHEIVKHGTIEPCLRVLCLSLCDSFDQTHMLLFVERFLTTNIFQS
jgi:hypothetical protein